MAKKNAHTQKTSARTAEQATARLARRAVHDKVCGGWNPLPVRAAQPASSQLYSLQTRTMHKCVRTSTHPLIFLCHTLSHEPCVTHTSWENELSMNQFSLTAQQSAQHGGCLCHLFPSLFRRVCCCSLSWQRRESSAKALALCTRLPSLSLILPEGSKKVHRDVPVKSF